MIEHCIALLIAVDSASELPTQGPGIDPEKAQA